MQDKSFLDNLNKLFSKKKFNEVIIKIKENNQFLKNYPDLYNISAVCKILKSKNTKNDIISALQDFENYFLNSKADNKKIEAVCNYIATCVVNSKKFNEINTYFKKAKNLYEKCVTDVGYDEKLYIRGAELYKYTLDHSKNKKILSELIKNKTKSKVSACAYGYMRNYTYDWGLKDYFHYSKKFENYFPKHNVQNINKINYKENKKVRIGFVSKDFIANHSITWLIKNTLLYFDKNKFETFGITLSDDKSLKGSSLELRNNFDQWFNFSKLKNEEIVFKIQEQRIEILIDTGGLFHADRIEIFNTRVAPIQISWVGYPNTVGFSTIDYLVSDENLIKKNEEKFYSEKIIKMPKIWNSHSGFKFERRFVEAPIKKNKYITFGSFNNFLKISDEVVKVWSKILKDIDNSKLILKSTLNISKDFVLQKFEKYGVHNSIIFYKKQEVEEHIKSYKNIDLALDTFPYNGVLTTFESLWAGVPVITMEGFNMMSRCGESILKNAQLEKLITSNKDDYIKLAIYYANNPDKLIDLRLKIYNDILKTDLFDSKQFSKDFQKKLMKVYKKN
jgi:protein O-GlcNAc transferase